MNKKLKNDLYDNQAIKVVTHCWAVNKFKYNLDFPIDPELEESCSTNGDAIFLVPYKWLKKIVNNNSGQYDFEFPSKLTLNTPEDFEAWDDTYTHSDGFIIFEEALKDNVLIGTPTVKHCKYCKENSLYK